MAMSIDLDYGAVSPRPPCEHGESYITRTWSLIFADSSPSQLDLMIICSGRLSWKLASGIVMSRGLSVLIARLYE